MVVETVTNRWFWHLPDNRRRSPQMNSLNVFDNRFPECAGDLPAPQTIRKHKRRILTALYPVNQGK